MLNVVRFKFKTITRQNNLTEIKRTKWTVMGFSITTMILLFFLYTIKYNNVIKYVILHTKRLDVDVMRKYTKIYRLRIKAVGSF